jgi:hypothetical protein
MAGLKERSGRARDDITEALGGKLEALADERP